MYSAQVNIPGTMDANKPSSLGRSRADDSPSSAPTEDGRICESTYGPYLFLISG